MPSGGAARRRATRAVTSAVPPSVKRDRASPPVPSVAGAITDGVAARFVSESGSGGSGALVAERPGRDAGLPGRCDRPRVDGPFGAPAELPRPVDQRAGSAPRGDDLAGRVGDVDRPRRAPTRDAPGSGPAYRATRRRSARRASAGRSPRRASRAPAAARRRGCPGTHSAPCRDGPRSRATSRACRRGTSRSRRR